ncbi:YggW family oxidoreductase, partial [Sodalis-like symbiont of Bactericera trigonica]
AEFTAFTGLTEDAVRPALGRALAGDYMNESASHWQVTEKGKLFLKSLLELFM